MAQGNKGEGLRVGTCVVTCGPNIDQESKPDSICPNFGVGLGYLEGSGLPTVDISVQR